MGNDEQCVKSNLTASVEPKSALQNQFTKTNEALERILILVERLEEKLKPITIEIPKNLNENADKAEQPTELAKHVEGINNRIAVIYDRLADLKDGIDL